MCGQQSAYILGSSYFYDMWLQNSVKLVKVQIHQYLVFSCKNGIRKFLFYMYNNCSKLLFFFSLQTNSATEQQPMHKNLLKRIFFSCFTPSSWSQSTQALYFLKENLNCFVLSLEVIQSRSSYSYNPSLTCGSILCLFCTIISQGYCSLPISIKCVKFNVNIFFSSSLPQYKRHLRDKLALDLAVKS